MAKSKGQLMLVKKQDADNVGTFIPVCGLNSKTFSINNGEIDVTTADCENPEAAVWKETLMGVKDVSISGDGFIEGGAAEVQMVALAMGDDNSDLFQVVIPRIGTFEGKFRLNLEYGGETEGGATYSTSLASTGKPTFTPAA